MKAYPYEEGYHAARVGTAWSACPYPTGSKEYLLWQTGHAAFHRDYEAALAKRGERK